MRLTPAMKKALISLRHLHMRRAFQTGSYNKATEKALISKGLAVRRMHTFAPGNTLEVIEITDAGLALELGAESDCYVFLPKGERNPDPTRKPIAVRAARCQHCGWTIYSRAHHDLHTCDCAQVTVDGGPHYFRVLWYGPKEPEKLLILLDATWADLQQDQDGKFGRIPPGTEIVMV